MRKALLLCASHNDLGLICALKKLGCFIVATGNKENAPGKKWVDKWIKADYSNFDVILSIAKEEHIDYICACCNDFGVYTAAYVAEQLKLPGYDSYNTTLTLHNKDKFKEFAKANNIKTPLSEKFDNADAACGAIQKMKLPVIVKPTDCSAGNGVSVVHDIGSAGRALALAFEKSRAKRIVIEPFITGTQHGLCTFLLNHKVVACCSNNEYSILNPFRVEIDTFPADNWDQCNKELIMQVEKIADILDLKDGIFHLQYICHEGEPWIIEVMRRTIGNMYHVPGNKLNGIDWEYWEAKARLGMDCSNFPQPVIQEGCFAYKTILAEKNGVIEKIYGLDEYDKYTFQKFMLLEEGDVITDYKKEPVGFLFMMFRNPDEMRKVLVEGYHNGMVLIKGE